MEIKLNLKGDQVANSAEVYISAEVCTLEHCSDDFS